MSRAASRVRWLYLGHQLPTGESPLLSIESDDLTAFALSSDLAVRSPVVIRLAPEVESDHRLRAIAAAALYEAANRLGAGDPRASPALTPQVASAPSEALVAEAGRILSMPRPAGASIQTLIDGYADYLTSLGRTRKHVFHTRRQCIAIVEGADIHDASELQVGPIAKWLAERRKQGEHTQATSNGYIAAIRAFSKWLVEEEAIPACRLGRLKRGNAEVTRVVKRRALTEDEAARLFDALPGAPEYRGTSWGRRAAIYAVGMLTGLRAAEIGSLRAEEVDLDARVITLSAAATKNRKNAAIPIHDDLVEVLHEAVNAAGPDGRLFPGVWWQRAAEMLRLDLHRAGVDPKDARGKTLDFHAATRVTFGTRLAEKEVPLQYAQKLMRHSVPQLTTNIYTDARPETGAKFVAKLPGVRRPGEGGQ